MSLSKAVRIAPLEYRGYTIAARTYEALRGAPYERTAGHLLVVTGLGPAGQVLVNDPAAHWPGDVRRTYLREDLERCWFEKGGVAYAFDPAEPNTTQAGD